MYGEIWQKIKKNLNKEVKRYAYPLWILIDEYKTACKHRGVCTQWEIDFMKRIIKSAEKSFNVTHEMILTEQENGKKKKKLHTFVLVTEQQNDKLEEISEKIFMNIELNLRNW